MNVKIRVNPAADGFIIFGFTGRPGDIEKVSYESVWEDTTEEYYQSNAIFKNYFTTISVSLYKDFDGARYYGPEVRFGNVSNSDWSYKYGPKSADDADLSMFPEFRYAPQFNGQINGQFNGQFSFTELTAAKSAEDAFETEEPPYAVNPDSFAAEFDKNGSVSLENVQIFYFDSDSNTAEINVEEGSAGSAPKSLGEPVPVPQDNSPFTLYVIGN